MEIHLIRHADAEELRQGLSDAERKLTEKGWRQAGWLASTLETLDLRYHTLVSSPWRRARETAYTLEHLADRVEVDALLASPPDASLLDFLGALEVSLEPVREPGPVALVGHQPWIGEMVSYLLFGQMHFAEHFRVAKASLYALDWSSETGGHLKFVLTPEHTRHMGGQQ